MQKINKAIYDAFFTNYDSDKEKFTAKELNDVIREVVGKFTDNPAGFMEHHGFTGGQHAGMTPEAMKELGITPAPFKPSATPWAGTVEGANLDSHIYYYSSGPDHYAGSLTQGR